MKQHAEQLQSGSRPVRVTSGSWMAIAALSVLVMTGVMMSGCGGNAPTSTTEGVCSEIVVPDIAARRAQFVEETLTADRSHLDEGDRVALGHLVKAAEALDEIFHLQAWRDNPTCAEAIENLDGPGAEAAKAYYRIMYGPWDRLKEDEPFIGTTPHPEGAGFYPADLTKEELEAWIEAHPEDRQAITSLHTIVRRDGDRLVAIPYSEAFAEQLGRASAEMRAAAEATGNQSLKHYLELRAEALSTDDYYESDMAWMDLDSDIEVVLGPYETYEDGLFGYKAAYEAFICVAQPEDSKRLEAYKKELPILEQSLPIPDEHKNLDRGSESPIRVVDEVFTAGDARAGVQTLAFNLPNDERVREAKGSKKVMLKNMMHAKFNGILEPIAARVLPTGQAGMLDFDAYFSFILFHELAHGLGPGLIELDGRQTEVRIELQDLYSAIEEAKADVVGIWSLYQLADTGVIDTGMLANLPWTYTAGLFRSARFGVTEAHGLGVVLQANYLLSKGAIEITEEGRFRPVEEAFPGAIEELAHELLMVEALGSYEGAQQLVAQYGTPPEAMMTLLGSLNDIPVDIDPVFALDDLG